MCPLNCLCLGLVSNQRLPNRIPSPLLLHHNRKPPEIIEFPPFRHRRAFLCPSACFPFRDNIGFFECFGDGAGTGTIGKRDGEWGEDEVSVGEGLAGDTCYWSIKDSLKSQYAELIVIDWNKGERSLTRLWSMI